MSSLKRTLQRAYKRRQTDWMEAMRKAAVKNKTTSIGAGTGLKSRKKVNTVENLGQKAGTRNMVASSPLPQRKGDR